MPDRYDAIADNLVSFPWDDDKEVHDRIAASLREAAAEALEDGVKRLIALRGVEIWSIIDIREWLNDHAAAIRKGTDK